MWKPLWRKEAQLEGIVAVCRIVNAENGEVNGDTNALTPSSWDCISLTIHPGFGEEEKEYKKKHAFEKYRYQTKQLYGCKKMQSSV